MVDVRAPVFILIGLFSNTAFADDVADIQAEGTATEISSELPTNSAETNPIRAALEAASNGKWKPSYDSLETILKEGYQLSWLSMLCLKNDDIKRQIWFLLQDGARGFFDKNKVDILEERCGSIFPEFRQFYGEYQTAMERFIAAERRLADEAERQIRYQEPTPPPENNQSSRNSELSDLSKKIYASPQNYCISNVCMLDTIETVVQKTRGWPGIQHPYVSGKEKPLTWDMQANGRPIYAPKILDPIVLEAVNVESSTTLDLTRLRMLNSVQAICAKVRVGARWRDMEKGEVVDIVFGDFVDRDTVKQNLRVVSLAKHYNSQRFSNGNQQLLVEQLLRDFPDAKEGHYVLNKWPVLAGESDPYLGTSWARIGINPQMPSEDLARTEAARNVEACQTKIKLN